MKILDLFKKKEPKEEYIPFEVKKEDKGSYKDFYKRLQKGSNIILITGKRGSGKTALGMKFLEMFMKKRKRVYAMGFD